PLTIYYVLTILNSLRHLTLLRPRPTPFPYTTLFRSFHRRARGEGAVRRRARSADLARRRRFASRRLGAPARTQRTRASAHAAPRSEETRLNSSHRTISYAVFCLKKKIYIIFLARYDG